MVSYTTAQLQQLIIEKYPPPEWALLTQVRNATGLQETVRTIDALAFGLYPSRGLSIHGFEIKVSRTDWLRELRQPAKADEIARYADYWWIVAPLDIILPGEMPTAWGHMVPFTGTLRVKKQAEQLRATAINREFLAAIMRRVQGAAYPGTGAQTGSKAAYREKQRTENLRVLPYEIEKKFQRLLKTSQAITDTIKQELSK